MLTCFVPARPRCCPSSGATRVSRAPRCGTLEPPNSRARAAGTSAKRGGSSHLPRRHHLRFSCPTTTLFITPCRACVGATLCRVSRRQEGVKTFRSTPTPSQGDLSPEATVWWRRVPQRLAPSTMSAGTHGHGRGYLGLGRSRVGCHDPKLRLGRLTGVSVPLCNPLAGVNRPHPLPTPRRPRTRSHRVCHASGLRPAWCSSGTTRSTDATRRAAHAHGQARVPSRAA